MNAFDNFMKKIIRHHYAYTTDIIARPIILYHLPLMYYLCLTGMNAMFNRIGRIAETALKT